jgi:hypothetical protein
MPEAISSPKRATGRTGSVCTETGPYSSAAATRAATVIVFFRKGDRFPPDIAGAPTVWTLVADGQRLSEGRLLKEAASIGPDAIGIE